jgi:sensor c-di-GMP phosphodiesterase-like protein
MKDAGSNSDALGRLSKLGYQIAIDDFGTGYSSLAYLRTFPVDLLKIDRTFVTGLGTNAQDTAIVTAVMAMAGSLGLAVVAEGVETAEQLAELRRLGCSMAQGHHMAPALPLDEALDLLASAPTW